ncbi:hypothetical protein SDC9_89178 [bioreactor metagenome]|uniref:Uncharacterized protein n=1 Tax=bioreactor metagenome TaxID=1076179 RepID=A0A644ZV42_9ZZZZ
MEADEDVATFRGGSPVVDGEVGVLVGSCGDDLKAALLELRLEQEMELPVHDAFIIGFDDGALVVLAAIMPRVEAYSRFTHRFHLLPRPARGRSVRRRLR